MEKEQTSWGGNSKPFSASYGKLMMWFFLISDALTFSGFLTAYGFARYKFSGEWPIADEVFTHFPGLHGDFPLLYVALMTFILIMSSVTMVLAVHHGNYMRKKAVAFWLFLTIIGGATFVGSQAWEWYHFIHGDYGAIKTSNGKISHIVDGSGHKVSLDVFKDNYSHDSHDSHSSHDSHDSHSSHDSHDSHDSHSFHDSHDSHDSHSSHDSHDSHYHHYAENSHFDHSDHASQEKEDSHDSHSVKLTKEEFNKNLAKFPELSLRTQQRNIVSHNEIMNYLGEDYEFVFGANLKQNEFGHPLFANFFFFITGFHGFHVFSGVIINIIVFIMVIKNVLHKRGHYEMVEKVGLYWHFVDLVWVFVFTFFYLI